jgi:hypothetical protein
MSRKRGKSNAGEPPPVFRRSGAGIPLFSPEPKGRIITAKMVQDAVDNEDVEEDMAIARRVMRDNRDALSELAKERMSQKRSEQTWDEVRAELDAAPIPDDFLSESERDMRPPQVRPAIEELFEDDNPTKPASGEKGGK